MKTLRQLAGFFRNQVRDAEMSEEMRAHLELQTRENIERGMSPEEAHYAALRTFGGVEQIKERCRDQRGFLWFEQLLQDLRYAGRSLRRNPGFAATIVLTLTIAIGANATIFSVVNAVLLEPLPYASVERLVNLRETRPVAGGTGRRVPVPVSPATYFDWRNAVGSFDEIAAVAPTEFTYTGGTDPEQVVGAQVSANLFPMLGVTPSIGRQFRSEENLPGGNPVALLSHAFWQRRLGGSAAVIDQPITLDGQAFTIVGVLPEWFDGTAAAGVARARRPDVWTPIPLVEAGAPRSIPAWEVHARLKPGATRAAAQQEVDGVMQRLAKDFPETNAARGGQVEPLVERIVGPVRSNLWMLFAAVGLVLLIACANIANLLLARATLRGGEVAMRVALGASRSRLVRQFLTESLLLALTGCALGLGATVWSVDALASVLPASLPRADQVAVDGRVLVFTLVVSLFTGVAFGLLPAWHGRTADLHSTLKTGGRNVLGSAASRRLRGALVVAQVALSLVLLIGAGLLLQSFVALSRVDPGFNPRNVLTLRVTVPPAQKYRSAAQLNAFHERLVERVQSVSGVDSAAMVFPLPFSGPIQNRPIGVPGRVVDRAQELSAETNIVSPEYFRALGIRITQGRAFSERDRGESPPVAMINETLAQRVWPGESPIGKRITVGAGRVPEREVVGVFADIKQRQLDSEPLLQACVPLLQAPSRTMYLAVRGSGAAPQLSAVRERLAMVDRDVPSTDIAYWSDRVSASVAPQRVTLWLLGGFAATALLLAIVGLYGVMSYMVAQRTREFGIRVALGAQWAHLLRLVVGDGMKLVLLGVLIGWVAAYALARVLAAVLFEVSPTDPRTFLSVSALLAVAAALACWLPARRAARVDPMVALRAE